MNFEFSGMVTPESLIRFAKQGRREAWCGLKREGWTDIVRRLARRLIGAR